ncbi:hypothetical protein M406DRAFT_60185 [Cryphonectria parasitica EP155]|uniref:tRNA-splicing endonuclease subunit Sen54 N-terminal domain-containing protein n=1 Tax=Cryphonectria parasitica (strain ATCC 38755 / EP155) TaxID=660469 RepID=A0A9P4Y2V5_CRYP1|nr:uncharacterized protein M406DRAFT_60185 [Cryphonectria parasitica EP155]KAF3765464.1 hypothetical protein M406DRAFT_60185 [Cryphonectria parasitica EP155]
MTFDDDDDLNKQPPAPQNPEQAQDTADEALEDEAQDFAQFASLQRKSISAQAIRKGEKDFESHGTRSQASALETSRRAMEDVLSYTRLHNPGKDWVRGWYFPERRYMLGTGWKIRGQGTQVPGWDQVWLLPEEALFLIERGTLDLWWPTASMAEIFSVRDLEEEDEYALGYPLSLQAAYALLVGEEGERGKVTLRNLQVFSNLNRAGFNVIRVPPPDTIPHSTTVPTVDEPAQSLWQRLLSLLFPEREPAYPAYGPLVRPGLYRSYAPIYKQLALIPRHRPTPHPPAHPSATQDSPFRVQYHIWRPGTPGWSKTKPPTPPDYHLAIVDAHDTYVPTGEEVTALLDSVPYAPPPERMKGHVVHQRLKHGHRHLLVAVVDHGVTNYLRIAEGAFGQEPLYPNFDSARGPRGGKRGGKGGGGGRGGRGPTSTSV